MKAKGFVFDHGGPDQKGRAKQGGDQRACAKVGACGGACKDISDGAKQHRGCGDEGRKEKQRQDHACDAAKGAGLGPVRGVGKAEPCNKVGGRSVRDFFFGGFGHMQSLVKQLLYYHRKALRWQALREVLAPRAATR